jgi:hypothetical protein
VIRSDLITPPKCFINTESRCIGKVASVAWRWNVGLGRSRASKMEKGPSSVTGKGTHLCVFNCP